MIYRISELAEFKLSDGGHPLYRWKHGRNRFSGVHDNVADLFHFVVLRGARKHISQLVDLVWGRADMNEIEKFQKAYRKKWS